MSMTDPIADLLTRIRNACHNSEPRVTAPFSGLKEQVLRVLREQGYIEGYSVGGEKEKPELEISLRYTPDGEKIIQHIQRVSKPGRRVFRKCNDLPRVLDGLGIVVVSTSRGVLSDSEAKKLGVGGEVICEVW
jgi:small subunit ribosomal protein S8